MPRPGLVILAQGASPLREDVNLVQIVNERVGQSIKTAVIVADGGRFSARALHFSKRNERA